MRQSPPVRRVVVGYEDQTSDAALAWAAAEARRLGTGLDVVHAYRREMAYPAGHTPWYAELDIAEVSAQVRIAAVAASQRAVEVVQQQDPRLEVTASVLGASTPSALVAASEHASVLVLGSRPGAGAGSGGSVAASVVEHAACLVVVVPAHDGSTPARTGPVGAMPAQGVGQVVVGVDDAKECSDAIGYAFAQAAARDTWLTAVHSSWVDPHYLSVQPDHDQHVSANQLADLNPELARWSRRYPGVRVHPVLSHQPVATGLGEIAEDAQLLVVGSRGRGAVASRLLGSVSRRLVLHPPCPVAVVMTGQLERVAIPADA